MTSPPASGRSAVLLALCLVGVLGCVSTPEAVAQADAAPAVSAATALTSPSATAIPANQVVARVNGEPIRQQALEQATTELVYQHLQQLGGSLAAIPPDQLQMLRSQIKPMALDGLINQTLFEQAKAKTAIEVTPEQLDQEKQRLNGLLADAGRSYEQFLAEQGLTEAQLESEMREQLETEQILEARVGELDPTEEEIRAFYDDNKDQLTREPMIRTSHILLKFPGDPRDPGYSPPTDAVKAGVRAKAEAVLEKVKASEDFAQLARDYSEGPSAPNGGDLGLHARGEMVDAYDAAAWALEVGQTSGLVETEFGFHIIKLTDKQAGGVPPYAELHDQLQSYLTRNKFVSAMQDYLTELRAQATIEETDAASTATTAQSPVITIP